MEFNSSPVAWQVGDSLVHRKAVAQVFSKVLSKDCRPASHGKLGERECFDGR